MGEEVVEYNQSLTVHCYGPTAIGQNNTVTGSSFEMEPYKPDEVKKIPRHVENFIGREDILDDIKEAFNEKPFVVVQGMAGVGKSAVALKFANDQMAQYQNLILVDINELLHISKDGKFFEEVCWQISREFYCNLTFLEKDKDICSLLQSTLKRFYIGHKRTLILLDNCEECLAMQEGHDENLPIAIKRLVNMATPGLDSQDQIHVLATSKCIADEQYFNNNVKNIHMAPFTSEETGRYLEHFPQHLKNYKETLHDLSRGCPLILEVFSKTLGNISNERNFKSHLEICKEKPREVAMGSSPFLRSSLEAALKILEDREKELAKMLSHFEGQFFQDYAKSLCDGVGADICCIQQLVNKGIITSNKEGYSMHPHLQKILNDMVPQDVKLHHKAILIVIYLKHLLTLGEKSFEKDKLSSTMKEFNDTISPFNHLIGILHSFSIDEKKEVRSDIENRLLKEKDPYSFYLLLRFLYPLVPEKKIETIFQFLLDASSQENTRSMIQACLGELVWDASDCHIFSENSHKYEYVMVKRRQLSDKVKEIRNSRVSCEDATYKNLKEELTRLLKTVQSLENKKIKAYYIVKVNKLLGQMAFYVKDLCEAIKYFKASSSFSDSTFGANFWSIDVNNHLAESHAESGESDSALELFEKTLHMAENGVWIDLPIVCTVYWAYSKFCLEDEKLKERAMDPLKKIIEISYHHNNMKFFSKASSALCINFKQHLQAVMKCICNLDVPNKELRGIVENVWKHKLQITSRSTKKEVIQEEVRAGVQVLSSAISSARCRVKRGIGDAELLQKAIFDWNRNIALYCPHVLLESERKPYADAALNIAEKNELDREYDVQYLKLVSEANNSKENEEMILEVSFIEKTNKAMAKANKHAEQKEIVLGALKNCQLEWLKLKLLTCLLELNITGRGEAIRWMNDIANILGNVKIKQLKPTYVILDAIDNMNIKEISDEEKIQFDNIFQQCIRKLGGSWQSERDMKCKFQVRYISILLKCNNTDTDKIMALMQTVLEYGGKQELRDIEEVKEGYQKYIQDHTSLSSKCRKFFYELMISMV